MTEKIKEDFFIVRARGKNLKTSVKKLQLIHRFIRKKNKNLDFYEQMGLLYQLKDNKKTAGLFYDVYKNLENNMRCIAGEDLNNFNINLSIILEKSKSFRRWRAVGRGRYHPTIKHYASINMEATLRRKI